MDYVRVRGTRLLAGDRPFYFAGANCHYLLTHAADVNQRPLVTEVLDDARRLNLTVMRCWAFCDGPEEWNALQPEPGKFNEAVLEGLDWLIVQAGRRGIRLILTLTNYWADYGGMPAYVRWRHGILDRTEHDYTRHPTSLFYTDPQCQAIFRRAVAMVIGRVNGLTGVPYVLDPAILGWELANEPRCEGPGGDLVLQKWVASTADFVRELDPHHLITVGVEGFYGPSTPELQAHNPYASAARHGADFATIFAHPSLDFASIHLYPDQWRPLDSSAKQLRSFMRNWIQTHAALCAGAGLCKPLLLSEFGKRDPNSYHGRDCTYNLGREDAFCEVLECCRELAAGGGPLAGVCAWMLAARQYPDYDGYTLRLGTQTAAAAEPTGPLQELQPEMEAEPPTDTRGARGGGGGSSGARQQLVGSVEAVAAEGGEPCFSGPGSSAGLFGGHGGAAALSYPPPQVDEPAVKLLRQYGEEMVQLCARLEAAGMAASLGEEGKAAGGAGAAGSLASSASGTARSGGGGGGLLRALLGRCFGGAEASS